MAYYDPLSGKLIDPGKTPEKKSTQQVVAAPGSSNDVGGGGDARKKSSGNTVQQQINAPVSSLPVRPPTEPLAYLGWNIGNAIRSFRSNTQDYGQSVGIRMNTSQDDKGIPAPPKYTNSVGPIDNWTLRNPVTYPNPVRHLAYSGSNTVVPTTGVNTGDASLQMRTANQPLTQPAPVDIKQQPVTRYGMMNGKIVELKVAPGVEKPLAVPVQPTEANIKIVIDSAIEEAYKEYVATLTPGTKPVYTFERYYAWALEPTKKQIMDVINANKTSTGPIAGNGAGAGAGAGGYSGIGLPYKPGGYTAAELDAMYPNAAPGQMGGKWGDTSNIAMNWQDSYGNTVSAQYYNAAMPKRSGYYLWNGMYYPINQSAIKAYKNTGYGGGGGWGGYSNGGGKWWEQMTNWTIGE